MMLNKPQIRRSTLYLYIENISLMILGHIFWLILSRMIGPKTLGICS